MVYRVSFHVLDEASERNAKCLTNWYIRPVLFLKMSERSVLYKRSDQIDSGVFR